MTRAAHYASRLAATFLGACLLAGTTLIPDAYADPNADPVVMPREFGNCMVGPSPHTFEKIMVFCGENKTDPSIIISTIIDDQKSGKIRIPIINYYDPHIKNLDQKISFDFGPYHHIPGEPTAPRGAWSINGGDLPHWAAALQALMSAETFSATSESGVGTVDLTGFSQAFQYFASEYKRIHNQPFPAWH